MNLSEFILLNEIVIRSSFFFGIFIVIAFWEIKSPRRQLTVSKFMRWSNNLAIVFINSALIRVLFPAAAVGVAVVANENNWGLLAYYEVNPYLAFFATIIFMDLIIYLQHVLVHAVPGLWRLHRVHHADVDYDVTTGARFHPLEIIFSMLIKFSIIVAIGAPVVAVIVFEIILNAMAMFNHGNIKLPEKLDEKLRRLIVTPDMHRVHHSVEEDETNSNFGFNLSIWDKIFGTYKAEPDAGQQGMVIGIHHFNKSKDVSWVTGMLMLPFKGRDNEYAINRRQWTKKEEEQ